MKKDITGRPRKRRRDFNEKLYWRDSMHYGRQERPDKGKNKRRLSG